MKLIAMLFGIVLCAGFSSIARAQLNYGGYGGIPIGGGFKMGPTIGGINLDDDDDDGPSAAQCAKALKDWGLPATGQIVVVLSQTEQSQRSYQSDESYILNIGVCDTLSASGCSLFGESDTYAGEKISANQSKPWMSFSMARFGCELAVRNPKLKVLAVEIDEHHTFKHDKTLSISFTDLKAAIHSPVKIDLGSAGSAQVYYSK